MTSATGRKAGKALAHRESSAFTLVELVIAISVLVILSGLAIPAIDSAQREKVAREPIDALYLMARGVRVRAMQERRPYQIVFDRDGFRASRMFAPYGDREDFEQRRIELEQLEQRDAMVEASRARGIGLSGGEVDARREEVEAGLRFFAEYELDPRVTCDLRFWDETRWINLNGGEFRRWIFQPSGMCEPLRVRIQAERAYFEIEFHPLTADIASETSWVE